MNKELLTPDIIKMARSLKRQLVEITPHYICGTDSLMRTFSIIYHNGVTPIDSDLYYFGPSNSLGDYDSYVQNAYKYDIYKQRMQYLRYQCQMVENNTLLMQYDNITKGQTYAVSGFVESLNKKAKDGMSMLNIDSTDLFISTCSTMQPINKPDIVSISVFPYTDISFMVKFVINKKNYIINEYIAYLYLV